MGIFRQNQLIFMGIFRHENWVKIPMCKIIIKYTFGQSEGEAFLE